MSMYAIYDRIYEWILSNGPKYLLALVVFLVGLWLIKIIRQILRNRLIRRMEESSVVPFVVSLCITALHILLIIFSSRLRVSR